ncbi:RELT-like protein 1 isoform X1 [Mauremys reevesii]|uniref:RELT-like protein 1 isoform X1 n=2 Tax=Mauremys reevesii TaxID=260615 RepID=UPI00194003CC|nr:RELT-like protein 1 isoform X1 [Mauremys reevesii]XP_039397270.1 RELT-like protein 1 isoform X1 [Mauremys reevesii]
MAPWESAATAGVSPAPPPGDAAAAQGNRSDLGNQDFPNILASHRLESTTTHAVSDHTGSGVHPEYLAYGLVPVFFIMGLLGILICHMLQKKGYRCRTEAEQEIEEEKLREKIEMNESVNDNNDTVGRIVNIIMKNEANADMLKAMVADNSVCDPESPVSPTTPGSPTSPGSPLSPGDTPSKHNCRGHHLHTVGGVVEKDVCSRCSHKRWHLLKPTNKSKEPRKSRQGEVTVLSVGRFRVTKVEHKSTSKERKSLMSVNGVEGVNGEVPATPVKHGSRDVPATPVRQGARGRTGTE